jgi:hypothetical protein
LPVHDWASHGADAFGGMAYRNPRTSRKVQMLEKGALRKAQRDTDPDERRSIRGGGFRRQRLGGY